MKGINQSTRRERDKVLIGIPYIMQTTTIHVLDDYFCIYSFQQEKCKENSIVFHFSDDKEFKRYRRNSIKEERYHQRYKTRFYVHSHWLEAYKRI